MQLRIASGLAIIVSGVLSASAYADSFSGSYLAGRYASSLNDHSAASRNFAEALEFDATNAQLLNDAIVAFVLRSDFDRALDWLGTTNDRSSFGQVPRLLTLSSSIRSEFFDDAERHMQEDAPFVNPVLAALLQGWIDFGKGDLDAAKAGFEALGQEQGLGIFGRYHLALLHAATGDDAGAQAIMDGGAEGPLHLDARSIRAHAIVTARAGAPDFALSIISNADPSGSDPKLAALRAEIARGEVPEFDLVLTPADGASEVFRAFSQLLVGEENREAALIYARFSQFLKPDQPGMALLVGELLRLQDQFALASAEFAKVAPNSPYFTMAELARADALAEAGSSDAAIAVLQGLERTTPDEAEVSITLGNILRFEERFADAEPVYSRALEKMPTTASNRWQVYYARGITRERTDQWDLAETDFRRALELEPNQPMVLNYLGYSLVEQQRSLEEALEMIKTAVEARPDDGYITDSLGWAYYRLGEYEKAVEPMERAAALVATDPIINDHLGDVYWKVGRKREAEFQWRRALSFEPEAEEIPKIRRKLEIGLDRFLEEEQAPESELSQN